MNVNTDTMSLKYSGLPVIALLALFTLFIIVSCDSKTSNSAQHEAVSKLSGINIGRLICGGHLPLAVVLRLLKIILMMPLLWARTIRAATAATFEKVLTTPPNWITYQNMVANENDMVSMAKKLVAMKFWTEVPENITHDYFDMGYAIKAERTMRNK